MDKINDINLIHNAKKSGRSEEFPYRYATEKDFYNKFIANVEKGDFCHAPTRYITELNLVKSLISTAEQFHLQEEVESFHARQEEINKELALFGIKIKD